jgi:hypothetical protein
VALNKQSVDISFEKGVETKTDPWRVALGSFLSLINMVFTVGMRLTKRTGYKELTALPSDATFLTTFNDNLTAVGSTLQALSPGTNSWVGKGSLQPVGVKTMPLVRSNTNQSQVDSVVSANGLVCTVYTDQTPTSLSTLRYMYTISDSVTGQSVVSPTQIPVSSGTVTGSPRVFLLGSYFVIVFTNVITATSHLQYIAISTSNPSNVTANADIAASYISATTLSWDGVVAESKLYVAYNTTSGGQAIKIASLSSTLILASAVTYSNASKVTATIMSMCADTSGASPIIYASYYDLATTTGFTVAVDANLNKIISTPAATITTGTVLNLTVVASSGVATLYYETSNNYSYDSAIPSHLIKTVTCTVAGTVGSTTTLVRSIGLASKAFIVDGAYYFLGAYQSSYQPTYFLMNSSGKVVSRFAYSNGGGYLTLGLPSVSISGADVSVGYLFKDFITSQNTSDTESVTKSNIYSQTGVNLATFSIGTSLVFPVEIGQALHLSGGFLWEYDGYQAVEHNFFLWPDSVEGTAANSGGSMVAQAYQYQAVYTWTDNQGNIHRSAPSIAITVDMSTANKAFTQPTPKTPTATVTSGSKVLSSVSSFTGIALGQVVTDTTTPANIQTGSYITAFDSGAGTITLSLPAAGGGVGDSLSIASLCSVTVNIPTLRLTYKTSNPVKIELFRWSTAQQAFYQVTSISQPLINSVTADSVSFSDIYADNQIIGNSLIYTTGSVVENIGAPAFNAMTLFDDRLWGIDAEDANLLWYSKQVIETTPVEMSDLFTLYVAPSIASQGSTGVMRCIAPMDDKLIIFKKDALYYINGNGPDNTGANSQYSEPIFITSVVGSTNQQSIVFTPNGLIFQSDKGLWLLNRGLGISYIGSPVEGYTQSASVQSAVSIPGTTQVRFTLDSGITLMYDYFYQDWATFSGASAISSTIYQGSHTIVNDDGLVFQQTDGTYLDGSLPVLMSFETSWIALGGLQGYQRAYYLYLLGKFITPHKIQVQVCYDYNDAPQQSTIFTPDNYSLPYGSDPIYGSPGPYGGPSSVEQFRVFFENQKCQAFKLIVSEIYDPQYQTTPGEGLTISGINLVVGVKSQRPRLSPARSVG